MMAQPTASFERRLERERYTRTQKALYERVHSSIDLDKFYKKIDDIYALSGAGVKFIDADLNIIELRPFRNICRLDPVYVILREPYKKMHPKDFSTYLKQNQDNIREKN